MKNSTPVAILLATYNSASYLAEQIESVLSQAQGDWTLYINDDGSEDDTLRIIEAYTTKYKEKIHNLDLGPKKAGTPRNFEAMLREVDALYYMFCDHDDVWLPGKIETTLGRMRRLEQEHPGRAVLVHTDLAVVDAHLGLIHPSFYKFAGTDPARFCSFNYLGVANCVTGCTMMFNGAAKKITPPLPDHVVMHDWWIALHVARAAGILSFIREPTILYRQHGKNVVGAKKAGLRYFAGILLHLKGTLKTDVHHYRVLKSVGYGSAFRYIYYKSLFQLRRHC